MISNSRLRHILCLLAAVLWLRPAMAQEAMEKEEQDLARKASSTLVSFANQAKSRKVGQRAKQAYDLVLGYAPDHAQTRAALDWEKKGAEWVLKPEEKRTRWVDKATYENRFRTADEWYKTCIKLGEMHRTLGLKLKEAGNAGRAVYHFDKAVYYNALDEEANIALGLEKGPGFYGTAAQIAFAHKMKEIEVKAVEFARKKYEFQELPQDQIPAELQRMQESVPDFMKKPDINIFGAKSKNFTVWTRGTQDNAVDGVMWAERALEFCVYLIGEDNAKRLQFVERATKSYAWHGFLFTTREREEFLKANPQIWEKGGTLQDALRFANTEYLAKDGAAVLKIAGSPKAMHDSLISYVLFTGLLQGRNDGLGQGLVHSVTWYLKATSISRWGALPEGTQGDDALQLPQGTNWWLRTVRDQATSTTDWPVAQVPREKLSRFRNDCRLKAWSFMTWMLAAYPDQWLKLFLAMPDADKQVPTLEQVEAVFVKEVGKSTEALDAEWREWARGDSGVAFGTGYGPPLLPERPSREELAAVDRVNEVRAQPIAFSWPAGGQPTEGSFTGLPECELDAEASLGCDAHASYVTNHPELAEMPGPEIHEENPAHEDFSRRGQLAGGGNIVTGNGPRGADFARDTVDLWIGTPYHRFPMLEHNIKRLGYSFVYANDLSVAVLDMGSLEEPYDPNAAPRFLVWPPPAMAAVPTTFPARESPNPLADQPENEQDVTKCGYPISLQFQRETALMVSDSSIELYESRKGGRPPAKNVVQMQGVDLRGWTERCKPKPVDIWVHTPKVPLNKKQDRRDVIFCLPKEPLDSNTQYQVRIKIQLGSGDPFYFIWEFTTGSQARGLKFK